MLEMPEYALYEIHESGQHLPTLLPSPSFNLRIVQYYDELALRCSRNFKNNFKKFNLKKFNFENSQFGSAVWLAIANKYMSKELYYSEYM